MESKQEIWLKRSMTRNAASYAKAKMESILAVSPVLREPSKRDVALFDKSEIVFGRTLGVGAFAIVKEVAAFTLDSHVSERLSDEQRMKRLLMAADVYDDNGHPRFAVKMIKEEASRKRNLLRHAICDIYKEGQYLERLNHPNIITLHGLPRGGFRVFEFGSYNDYFLILDTVEALHKRINQWNCEEDCEILPKMRIARQIASALDYLHQQRLLYRDLKPQNIGLGEDDQVKLFDFGLVRELPPGARLPNYEMSAVGTPRYMAPETLVKGKYNETVDVYSWSMVVWEMLHQRRPFAQFGRDKHKVLVCVDGKRPGIATFIPNEIRTLLVNTWSKDTYRWSMGEVLEHLDEWLLSFNAHQEINESANTTTTTITPTNAGIEVAPTYWPFVCSLFDTLFRSRSIQPNSDAPKMQPKGLHDDTPSLTDSSSVNSGHNTLTARKVGS